MKKITINKTEEIELSEREEEIHYKGWENGFIWGVICAILAFVLFINTC